MWGHRNSKEGWKFIMRGTGVGVDRSVIAVPSMYQRHPRHKRGKLDRFIGNMAGDVNMFMGGDEAGTIQNIRRD